MDKTVARLLADSEQVSLELRTSSGSNNKHQDMDRPQDLEGPGFVQDEKRVAFSEKAWLIEGSVHLPFNESRKTTLKWLLPSGQ